MLPFNAGTRRNVASRANVVEASDDAILALDAAGRIRAWNGAAERIFGRPRAAALGERLESLVPEDAVGTLREALGKVASGQRIGHLESGGLRSDGGRLDLSLSLSPMHGADGEVSGVAAVVRDVTDARDLQRRLKSSEELASLATVIAGIAHDIGTPLNVIIGYADMLARGARDATLRERLGIVRDEAGRVVRLIQSLLNFTRGEPETPAEVCVDDVLERTLALLRETTRRRGIEVQRDFGATAPLRVRAERLERAFLNLLVNAADAMAA